MRVDISGVISENPTIRDKSASFKLMGGGPYLYAYGQFGEQLVGRLSKGSAILASGSVNYAQDGQGDWEKYINLTGHVTLLGNKKVGEDEKAKITFVSCGVITKITPQQTKGGNMAKFTVAETTVDFRGAMNSKHSMVAFEDVADKVLAMQEGQTVMVAGNVTRVRGRGDNWYTSFTATAVVPVEASAVSANEPTQPVVQEQESAPASASQEVDEDDLPF